MCDLWLGIYNSIIGKLCIVFMPLYEIKNYFSLVSGLVVLGVIAAAEGNNEQARELLGRAREMLEAAKMPEWDAKSWKEINDLLDELKSE